MRVQRQRPSRQLVRPATCMNRLRLPLVHSRPVLRTELGLLVNNAKASSQDNTLVSVLVGFSRSNFLCILNTFTVWLNTSGQHCGVLLVALSRAAALPELSHRGVKNFFAQGRQTPPASLCLHFGFPRFAARRYTLVETQEVGSGTPFLLSLSGSLAQVVLQNRCQTVGRCPVICHWPIIDFLEVDYRLIA